MTWYRLYFLLGQLLVKSRGQCVVEVECRVSAGQGGGVVVVGERMADDVGSDKEWMVGRRVGVRWLRQRISGLLSRVRRDGVDGHYCVPAAGKLMRCRSPPSFLPPPQNTRDSREQTTPGLDCCSQTRMFLATLHQTRHPTLIHSIHHSRHPSVPHAALMNSAYAVTLDTYMRLSGTKTPRNPNVGPHHCCLTSPLQKVDATVTRSLNAS